MVSDSVKHVAQWLGGFLELLEQGDIPEVTFGLEMGFEVGRELEVDVTDVAVTPVLFATSLDSTLVCISLLVTLESVGIEAGDATLFAVELHRRFDLSTLDDAIGIHLLIGEAARLDELRRRIRATTLAGCGLLHLETILMLGLVLLVVGLHVGTVSLLASSFDSLKLFSRQLDARIMAFGKSIVVAATIVVVDVFRARPWVQFPETVVLLAVVHSGEDAGEGSLNANESSADDWAECDSWDRA